MTQRATSAYERASQVERIERAILVVAYIVRRHGEVYGPLLDRLEEELESAQRANSYQDRAQRILARGMREVSHASAV